MRWLTGLTTRKKTTVATRMNESKALKKAP
jgi:adenylylsulfate kinase-like enzyme